MRRLRVVNKEYFNNTYRTRQNEFKVKDIVILFNI